MQAVGGSQTCQRQCPAVVPLSLPPRARQIRATSAGPSKALRFASGSSSSSRCALRIRPAKKHTKCSENRSINTDETENQSEFLGTNRSLPCERGRVSIATRDVDRARLATENRAAPAHSVVAKRLARELHWPIAKRPAAESLKCEIERAAATFATATSATP